MRRESSVTWRTISTRRWTTSRNTCNAISDRFAHVLWYAANDPKLSRRAKETLENDESELLISIASIWELAIKESIGKLALNQTIERLIPERSEETQIVLLGIEYRHVAQVAKLPFHHRDPFDRMLIAQCIIEQIPIISADSAFDAYGIERIW